MCKKIAQLTKVGRRRRAAHRLPRPRPPRSSPAGAAQVIYALHTRTEDHAFDLQELTEQYEAEVQAALRDGESKLQQQQAQLQQDGLQACAELQAQVGGRWGWDLGRLRAAAAAASPLPGRPGPRPCDGSLRSSPGAPADPGV
jgi:hypothetical protein